MSEIVNKNDYSLSTGVEEIKMNSNNNNNNNNNTNTNQTNNSSSSSSSSSRSKGKSKSRSNNKFTAKKHVLIGKDNVEVKVSKAILSLFGAKIFLEALKNDVVNINNNNHNHNNNNSSSSSNKMNKEGETEMAEDDDEDDEIIVEHIPSVTSSILSLIVDFCDHYLVEKLTDLIPPLKSDLEDLVQPWYMEFLKRDDVHNQIFMIMMACNYLDLKPMLDLVSSYIVSCSKGKSVKEIRETFHITTKQTEQDDKELYEKCNWCELGSGEL